MAQQDNRDKHLEETVDPKNPPNSVLRPEVRRATLSTFLGGIIVFFVVIAAALIYWRTSGQSIDPDPGARGQESGQIGTTGGTDQPGGFNPAPRPDSTREELEFRGGDLGAAAVTRLDALLEDRSASVGKQVDLHDVDVASAESGGFWIHDGNAKVEVLAPAGSPVVQAGQSVDVSGAVEADGHGGVRIRAARVAAR